MLTKGLELGGMAMAIIEIPGKDSGAGEDCINGCWWESHRVLNLEEPLLGNSKADWIVADTVGLPSIPTHQFR